MYKQGNINAYKYDEQNTVLQIVIPERIHELQKYSINGVVPVEIRIDDGRTITVEQRKKAYATINDISVYTGHAPEFLKEYFKYIMIAETGVEYISLSSCTVTEAREYINTLIEFCIQHGVELQQTLIERTDDIAMALIFCLRHRKCCLCGRDGEIHHIDAIGMGNDRKVLDDSEHEVMALCRKHHSEAHQIGVESFQVKYKVFGIKRKYVS